jgi:hypothetical protein
MGLFLLFALAADLLILAAAQMRSQSWAGAVCRSTLDLCDHPVALLVAAVILGGIFLVQR